MVHGSCQDTWGHVGGWLCTQIHDLMKHLTPFCFLCYSYRMKQEVSVGSKRRDDTCKKKHAPGSKPKEKWLPNLRLDWQHWHGKKYSQQMAAGEEGVLMFCCKAEKLESFIEWRISNHTAKNQQLLHGLIWDGWNSWSDLSEVCLVSAVFYSQVLWFFFCIAL